MQTGVSPFSTTPLSAPTDVGADPRRLFSATLEAAGGLQAKISLEAAASATMDLGGGLDAPFVRIRRTGLFFQGVFGQGVDVRVSPVMVTLDGGGGLSCALLYSPGRVRAKASGSGGLVTTMNAVFRARAHAAADPGFVATLSEYQKFKSSARAGGGLQASMSRKHHASAVFRAGGGLRVSPWYELIGEVDHIVAARPQVLLVIMPRPPVAVVSRTLPEDLIVLEVGI